MNLMVNVVTALQVIAALVMIALILVQQGKGADMGASFGSGAAGSLFGAAGSANAMSRATAICATIFFAATLSLTYMSSKEAKGTSGSVLDRPAANAAAASAPPARGAALIPTTAIAASAAASGATPVKATDPASAVAASAAVAASGALAIPAQK